METTPNETCVFTKVLRNTQKQRQSCTPSKQRKTFSQSEPTRRQSVLASPSWSEKPISSGCPRSFHSAWSEISFPGPIISLPPHWLRRPQRGKRNAKYVGQCAAEGERFRRQWRWLFAIMYRLAIRLSSAPSTDARQEPRGVTSMSCGLRYLGYTGKMIETYKENTESRTP